MDIESSNEVVLTPSGFKGISPKKPKVPTTYQRLTPITPEDWAKLSPKAQWDSIVALRGPDLRNSDTLKWFTSSVIRWKLSGIMRVGGMVNDRLPFVVLPGFYDNPLSAPKGDFSGSHFAGHVQEAAMWLQVPVVGINPETWALILKGGSTAKVKALEFLRDADGLPPQVKASAIYLLGGDYA